MYSDPIAVICPEIHICTQDKHYARCTNRTTHSSRRTVVNQNTRTMFTYLLPYMRCALCVYKVNLCLSLLYTKFKMGTVMIAYN